MSLEVPTTTPAPFNAWRAIVIGSFLLITLPVVLVVLLSCGMLALLLAIVGTESLARVANPITYFSVWRMVFPWGVGRRAGAPDSVPLRVGRLRASDGSIVPVRFVGHLDSGDPSVGDDCDLDGLARDGTFFVRGGRNRTTGARIVFAFNPWIPVLVLWALLLGAAVSWIATRIR